MNQIPEPDWKVFKPLYELAVERLKRRILAEFAALIADETKSVDDRYLELYRSVKERDKDLGMAFDGFSRSRAPMQIAWMRTLNLITEEEFGRFSEETRTTINRWQKAREE